jgi:hypothetical protein
MSIRRAVEWHFKTALTEALATQFPTFQVIESLRQEERPIPCVLIVAGDAEPALGDLPDSAFNYYVNTTVLVMSSIDKDTVNNHSEVGYEIKKAMRLRINRRGYRIQGLYVYDIEEGSVGEDNADRQMGTGINFRVVCHYDPQP